MTTRRDSFCVVLTCFWGIFFGTVMTLLSPSGAVLGSIAGLVALVMTGYLAFVINPGTYPGRSFADFKARQSGMPKPPAPPPPPSARCGSGCGCAENPQNPPKGVTIVP